MQVTTDLWKEQIKLTKLLEIVNNQLAESRQRERKQQLSTD
jgi:hypothetical protein